MRLSLHDTREAARTGSSRVSDPRASAFVYRMTGIESGRDHGYTVGYSIEPEPTSKIPGNGTKVRLSLVARFFHGRELPRPGERRNRRELVPAVPRYALPTSPAGRGLSGVAGTTCCPGGEAARGRRPEGLPAASCRCADPDNKLSGPPGANPRRALKTVPSIRSPSQGLAPLAIDRRPSGAQIDRIPDCLSHPISGPAASHRVVSRDCNASMSTGLTRWRSKPASRASAGRTPGRSR